MLDSFESISAFAKVRAIQGPYQPFYGRDDDGQSPRADLLRRNCQFVVDHYADAPQKQQVRIIDIGCNAGFTTLTLAETFPSIVGYEISDLHLTVCRELAAAARSPATFKGVDIFATDVWETEVENIDCALLFNVIHQLIFSRGLAFTQTLIGRLVRQVDVLFIELARREDYPNNPLPADPAEALAGCVDADIVLLADNPRPLYKITRKTASVGHLRIRPERIVHSGKPESFLSRKFYFGENTFMKVFRLNKQHPATNFNVEVDALRKLLGVPFSPQILDWAKDHNTAAILMQRINGPLLKDVLPNLTVAEKRHYARCILELHAQTHPAVGYHNDISAHNLIVKDGALYLIDYEQSLSNPLMDPYAALLWSLTDIWEGSAVSYKRNAIGKLLQARVSRAPLELYPEVLPPLADITVAAHESTDWLTFVKEWAAKPTL